MVPATLAAVDPAWLGQQLRDGGYANAEVESVTAEQMTFVGVTSDMARFRVSYATDASAGPPSMIAKIRGTDDMRAGLDRILRVVRA